MRASSAGRILAFALVAGLVGPTAGHAEIISVPAAAPSDPAAPTPTVLRGSPPASPRPVPVCPPGYILSPDYGCVGASGGDYTEGSAAYDDWPDNGFGYPFGGFSGFGFNTGRVHRFAGLHGGHGFHRKAGFHRQAKFAVRSAGAGHMGGFGRR